MTPALWTSADAAAATGGVAAGTWAAGGVSIDSRSVVPGDLFVALSDARDGHDFVADALARGAVAALVNRRPPGVADTAHLLIVADVLSALRDLARAARARTAAKVIAVTGSVGKTSTKEMLRSALAGQGRIHAAERSFNNHWGVPLTLARMPADTDVAVLEIGMNHAGEIAPLSRLARPDVAIVTTVAEVHMAAFNSLRQIAHAKAEIFEGLAPGGVAILNRDTSMYPVLNRAAARRGARQVRFGMAGRPEFALTRTKVGATTTTITYRHDRQIAHVNIGAPGKHFATGALATLAAVDAIGLDLARAGLGLANWRPPEGRGTRTRVGLGLPSLDGAILLIDESYNANPTSVAAALAALAATPLSDTAGGSTPGRRIAVIGDMLELGPTEAARHAELATLDALGAIDTVHTVGPLAAHLHRALAGSRRGRHFATAQDALILRRDLRAGDVVMIKGSNGVRLIELVDAIKNLGQASGNNPDGA